MIPLLDKVTITKSGGLDPWGKPLPGVATEYACRISETVETIRKPNGEEVVSKGRVLLKGYVDVDYPDSLSWSIGDGTRTEKPISIIHLRDLSGKILFTKVVV